MTIVSPGTLILTLQLPEPVMLTQPTPAITKSTADLSHPTPRTYQKYHELYKNVLCINAYIIFVMLQTA
jgi:hypothetical protein